MTVADDEPTVTVTSLSDSTTVSSTVGSVSVALSEFGSNVTVLDCPPPPASMDPVSVTLTSTVASVSVAPVRTSTKRASRPSMTVVSDAVTVTPFWAAADPVRIPNVAKVPKTAASRVTAVTRAPNLPTRARA